MRGGLLAIHEAESPGLQLAHEGGQHHFRGVVYFREHRFCEESSTDCHAVEAGHQFSFLPGFNGVGVSLFVKFRVGLDYSGRDPGAAV